MFIPIDHKNSYKKGNVVILIDDKEISYGKFLKGHEFIITDKDGYGYIMKDLEHGIIVDKTNFTEISLKISFEEAKKLHIKRKEKIKFKEFLTNTCPNKEKRIDEREYYDACKIGKGYINSCKPKTKCLKYINDKHIKDDEFIIDLLRRKKIKKCLKKMI